MLNEVPTRYESVGCDGWRFIATKECHYERSEESLSLAYVSCQVLARDPSCRQDDNRCRFCFVDNSYIISKKIWATP